jgi:hypothetical protein
MNRRPLARSGTLRGDAGILLTGFSRSGKSLVVPLIARA